MINNYIIKNIILVSLNKRDFFSNSVSWECSHLYTNENRNKCSEPEVRRNYTRRTCRDKIENRCSWREFKTSDNAKRWLKDIPPSTGSLYAAIYYLYWIEAFEIENIA